MPRQALMVVCAALLAGELGPAFAQDPKSHDPVIVRADIIYSDPKTESLTPSIVRAGNGDLVVSIATRGDGMPSQSVAMAYIRSSDQGKTWSAPYMTSRTDKPLTGLGESLQQLPGGRLLRYSLELVWPAQPDQARADYLALAGGRKFDSYFSIDPRGSEGGPARQDQLGPPRRGRSRLDRRRPLLR